MKSLQEKQHIEPTSYCGENGDISGQIEEEDGETALLESDSRANFSKDNKNCESSPNLRDCQILDIHYNKNEFMMNIIEDNEQHDFIRFGNKQEGVRLGSISALIGEENHRIVEKESHMVDEFESTIGSGTENVFTVVKTSLLETDPLAKLSKDYTRGENSGNKHMVSWDKKSCGHEPISASIEDIKQLNFMSQDMEEILEKSYKNMPKDCAYHKSSPRVLNKKQNKVNHAVKGYKRCGIAPEVTGHCSSPGDFLKSEHRTKSGTVILTQTSRDSSEKRNGQNNACSISNNQTVDRILSSKYASVAPPGSHKEVISKVTTPRSSFATVKPGVSSIRASRTSDRNNILFSSPVPLNIISKGISSRLGVPHSQKREKLESKWEHEELGKKPFATDRQAAYLMGGSPSNVIRPLKARSVNLPTLRRGDADVGINLDKLARNNKVGKLKQLEMGHCSSPGDFLRFENRTKSGTVILTQTLRDSSQKRNRQNNSCIISTNQTSDRILSSKYASVAPHGSSEEVNSKVTNPRSSFATVKTSGSSIRASQRSDRNNILFSSISKGVSSRLGVPHGQKREKLESRREHEELGKKPFATDRQAAYLMGGNPSHVIWPLKARGDTDVEINLVKLAKNNKVGKLKQLEMMASSTIRDLTTNSTKKPPRGQA